MYHPDYRRVRGRRSDFCGLNRSNPWTQPADTTLFLLSKTKVAIDGEIRRANGDPHVVPKLSTDNRYYPLQPRTHQEIGVTLNRALTVVRRSGVLCFESTSSGPFPSPL
jgi:hypothetical protein